MIVKLILRIVVFISLFFCITHLKTAQIVPPLVSVPVGHNNSFLDVNRLYTFSEQEFFELVKLLKEQEFNVTNSPGELSRLFDELAKIDAAGDKLYKAVIVYKNVADPSLIDLFLIEDEIAGTGNAKVLNKQNSYHMCRILEVEKDNNIQPARAPVQLVAGKRSVVFPAVSQVEKKIKKISFFNFYKKVKRLVKEESDNYAGLRPMQKTELFKLFEIMKSKRFLAVSFEENMANSKSLKIILKEKLDGSIPDTTFLLSEEFSNAFSEFFEDEQKKLEKKNTLQKRGNSENSYKSSTKFGVDDDYGSSLGTKNKISPGKGSMKKSGNRGQGYAGGSYKSPSRGYSGGHGNYGNRYSDYSSSPYSSYGGGSQYGNQPTAYTGSGPLPVSSAGKEMKPKDQSIIEKITREITHINSEPYERRKRNKHEINDLENYFFGLSGGPSSQMIKQKKEPNRYAQAVKRSIEYDNRKKRAQHDLLSNNESSLSSTNNQKEGIVAAISNVINSCYAGIKYFFNWLYESTTAYF